MRIINREAGAIDYRLNLLGVRVWKDAAQLIAKYGEEWTTIGNVRKLPVRVPTSPSELKDAANDTLRLTAYQYEERPNTDLRELMGQKKEFESAAEFRRTAGSAL